MTMTRACLVSAVAGALLLSWTTVGKAATTGEYGDECAMGLARGKDIPTDCSINAVIDGKTYCFGNEQAKAIFLKDPEGFLAKAQAYYASKKP
jgi:YHS domain-containing protein